MGGERQAVVCIVLSLYSPSKNLLTKHLRYEFNLLLSYLDDTANQPSPGKSTSNLTPRVRSAQGLSPNEDLYSISISFNFVLCKTSSNQSSGAVISDASQTNQFFGIYCVCKICTQLLKQNYFCNVTFFVL